MLPEQQSAASFWDGLGWVVPRCAGGCGTPCGTRPDALSRGQDAADAEEAVLRVSDESCSPLHKVLPKDDHLDPIHFCGAPAQTSDEHIRHSCSKERRSRGRHSHRLTERDLRLSRTLTKQLGLEDKTEEEEEDEEEEGMGLKQETQQPRAQEQSPAQKQLSPWALPLLGKNLQHFRQLIGTQPIIHSATEIDRGVRIDSKYDYYDASAKKWHIRKMDSSVFHVRSCGSQATISSGASTLERKIRSSSTSSSASKASESDSPRPRTKAALNAESALRRSNTRHEALARWGVLIGKVLRARVLAFTHVADKAIHRRKYHLPRETKGAVLQSVRQRARAIVGQARKLAKQVASEQDRLDSEWDASEDLLIHLFSTQYLDNLILITRAAVKMLSVQPPVAEATVPCRIFGDLHGQLRDLLMFFWAFGSPDQHDAPSFVFNGDFVDRGDHQLEVVGLLLSLKVLLPERVWLVRGNHEDRNMNEKYGFAEECRSRLGSVFGAKIFELVHTAFDQLPLACLISEQVLIVHGGIGDGLWQLSDLQAIKRPLKEDQFSSWIFNILWSDPIEDDAGTGRGVFGVHESPRGGLASKFGWNVTKTFCARNGLSLIVRSHQSKQDSLGFNVMHDNLLVRVFSARDYEGHGNDGAVLFITPSEDNEPLDDGRDAEGCTKPTSWRQMLTVHPQVLASTTKARKEALALENSSSGGDEPVRRRSSDRFAGDKPVRKRLSGFVAGDEPVRRRSSGNVACDEPARRRSSGSVAGDEPVRRRMSDSADNEPGRTRSSGRPASEEPARRRAGGGGGSLAVPPGLPRGVSGEDADDDAPSRRRSSMWTGTSDEESLRRGSCSSASDEEPERTASASSVAPSHQPEGAGPGPARRRRRRRPAPASARREGG